MAGHEAQEVVGISLAQTKEMLMSFRSEYLMGLPVLDIPVELGYRDNGEMRMVAAKYGGVLWEDVISEKERGGTVKAAMRQVERFVVDAPEGSAIVVTSPPGPHGMLDSQGWEKAPYDKSQTYLFRVGRGGFLEGVTLVSDMSLEENEQLMRNLDGYSHSPELTYRERVYSVSARAALLAARPGEEWTFDGLIDRIAHIRGKKHMSGGVTYEQVKKMVTDRGQFETEDQKLLEIIGEFEAWVEHTVSEIDEASLGAMGVELGKTILHMSAHMRGVEKQHMNYRTESARVAAIAGCNGGGVMENAFGPRSTDGGCARIRCRGCGWVPDVIDMVYIRTGELTACPDCLWSPN